MIALSRTVRTAVAVSAVLAAVLAPSAASAARTDDPATACNSGGFASYANPATGRPFKNQGQCVSFVNHGGELRPVAPAQVVTSSLVNVAYPDPDRATFQVAASGLTPQGPAYIRLITADGTVIWQNTGWADADGEWLYPGIQVACGFGPLTITVGDSATGVESAPLSALVPSSCTS